MQLVAYGAQDIYLTGNPQITFFKVVYRRHTNFAVESIEQTFNGASAMGQKFSCTISRNGDLLSRVYLEIDISLANNVTGNNEMRAGFKLLDHVEVEIGGQCIDKHYGNWMNIWTDLTHTGDQADMLKDMVGLSSGAVTDSKLYVPLQFWFCRNPGLALPLIALQYHEVKLNVQFNSEANAAIGGNSSAGNVTKLNTCVFCDYIFLDTDERRRFAQVSHEYLIEQVQSSNLATLGANGGEVELRFNHPVKELFWHTGTSFSGTDIFDTCLLQLNGHDRFRKRAGSYFNSVQRYEHHTGEGQKDMQGTPAKVANDLHMYSFALKPEEHQPSGTCNFSRIDNAVLVVDATNITLSQSSLQVYAMNYNVLRIMSGMGGLAYSN